MSVIYDNNFSTDTNAMRTARLLTIQENFGKIQDELDAPAHLFEWSKTCFDNYLSLGASLDFYNNRVEGRNIDVSEYEAKIEQEYQIVRGYGKSIYPNNENILADYGFNRKFPRRRSEKISRITLVLQTYAQHKISGLNPLIPQVLIDRLNDAKNQMDESIEESNKQKIEYRRFYVEFWDLFKSDSAKLNELKAWWFAKMGKNNPGILLIGMRNPKK